MLPFPCLLSPSAHEVPTVPLSTSDFYSSFSHPLFSEVFPDQPFSLTVSPNGAVKLLPSCAGLCNSDRVSWWCRPAGL